MTYQQVAKIVYDAINSFNASHLIRVIGQNGNTDSIKIKEKKPTNTNDETRIENVIAACELKKVYYKSIGVGFDYNSKEYTMIFSPIKE